MTLEYEKELCSEPNCFKVRYGKKSICQYHYNLSLVARRLLLECIVDSCTEGQYQGMKCRKHYAESFNRRITTTCSVSGCGNKTKNFQSPYCNGHYIRLSRFGTLNASVPIRQHSDRAVTRSSFKEFAEFESLIRFAGPDDCWLWQGPQSEGYGRFSYAGRKYSAHVETYKNFGFDIPDGYQLDHLCRVTLCCNPSHLEPVTPEENVGRMARFWSQYDPCQIDDCTLQGVARGLCAKHYREQFLHISGKGTRESEIMYLTRRIRIMGDGCWDWMGSITTSHNDATPKLRINGVTATAYRYIYMKEKCVQLTREQHLDHLCRNRICVNPEHLEVVTHEENNRRRWEADRARIKQLEEGEQVA